MILPALALALAVHARCASSPDPGDANGLAASIATYRNPVVEDNCPDPSVVRLDEGGAPTFYMVCTSNFNALTDKFPIRRSPDLVHWERVGFVFLKDQRPTWARADFWAPEIDRVGDHFVAYFAARDETGHLVLGAAVADRPEGPYKDLGKPFLREDFGGVIDPHYFEDEDGRSYLYWKEDRNALVPPEATPIVVQELSTDGLHFKGPRTSVLTSDKPWEGGVVEGPWVMRRDGTYYLFYSGNTFNSERYATGVARAPSPLGPFEKLPAPIVHSNPLWIGPGHGAVVRAGNDDWYVYAAWQPGRIDISWDRPLYPRMALLDRLTWDQGWPRIQGGTPSTEPQPVPQTKP